MDPLVVAGNPCPIQVLSAGKIQIKRDKHRVHQHYFINNNILGPLTAHHYFVCRLCTNHAQAFISNEKHGGKKALRKQSTVGTTTT